MSRLSPLWRLVLLASLLFLLPIMAAAQMFPQQPPFPNNFIVTSAASTGITKMAPGSLASAFITTGVSQNFIGGTIGGPLPFTAALGGVSLLVGGTLVFDVIRGAFAFFGATPVPLVFVGPFGMTFQIPTGISSGIAVPAILRRPDGTTLMTTMTIAATAPAIFTVLSTGVGQAAVLNQDNSRNGMPPFTPGARPAARGSVIQIFGTGAGGTTPALLPGQVAPISGNPLVLSNVQPIVMIGGVQAQVLFSGIAPGTIGVWQINVLVPSQVAPGSAVPIVISAGGVSSNTATIAVE